jgi:hypothetical protein
MKPKQKRVVAVLVALNVVVILGLVLWVSQSLNTGAPTALPSTQDAGVAEASVGPVASPSRDVSTTRTFDFTHTPLSSTASYDACQWRAAQLMTDVGLDGAVLVSDDILRFDIAHSLAPGRPADEAAQSIWLAFDVALALVEEACAPFTQVDVVVLAQGNQTRRISARVSTADLVAFDAGELDEDAFIQRVDYQIDAE